MVGDVPEIAARHARRDGGNVMFEGAQGALLDIDHGTYPVRDLVEHHRRWRGLPAAASGPRDLDYILGITKAYTTRVGAGPFPPNCSTRWASTWPRSGHEFGSTTGRRAPLRLVRCRGACAVRQPINSVTGLCITKLDVLDGLSTLRIGVAYRLDGRTVTTSPIGADLMERCEPEYIEMPGW